MHSIGLCLEAGSNNKMKENQDRSRTRCNILISMLFTLLLMNTSVSFAQSLQISKLRDLTLGTLDTFDKSASSVDADICIYSIDGNYTVTIDGQISNKSFALSQEKGTIPIIVKWNNKPGTQGNIPLQPGEARVFSDASLVPDCPDGNTANIQIIIPASVKSKLRAGRYLESLNITIGRL